MAFATPAPVLIDRLWSADTPNGRLVRMVTLAVIGSLILAISAKIKIPLEPVHVTMQVFVILTIGATMGSRLAVATVLLYLAQGAAGLPVFTGTPEKGIGLAYMMGGTGGYLLGYVFAAYAVGWLAERGWDRSFFSAGAAMIVGVALIYIPGVLWLGGLFGWDKPILEWGLYPFIGADLLKAALAMAVMPIAWKLTGKRH